jgi:hypothetical protein
MIDNARATSDAAAAGELGGPSAPALEGGGAACHVEVHEPEPQQLPGAHARGAEVAGAPGAGSGGDAEVAGAAGAVSGAEGAAGGEAVTSPAKVAARARDVTVAKDQLV